MLVFPAEGLHSLLSETTPQRSVGYTYDAASRRQTMTVSGQANAGTYGYDPADRPTGFMQGPSNVFSYDAVRRRDLVTLATVWSAYSLQVSLQSVLADFGLLR